MNGVVKFFNASKNYGFITGDNETDYFFHVSGVEGGEVLNEGDKVTFEVVQGDKGEQANDVKVTEHAPRQQRSYRY